MNSPPPPGDQPLVRKKKPIKEEIDSKATSRQRDEVTESGAGIDIKTFKTRFPHLATELEDTTSAVRIEGVRWENTNRTERMKVPGQPRFAGYSPDVVDFLRRCTTEEEALEIIAFLEERKELDSGHARVLRRQLKKRGLRSFGSKKSWGYYERDT